MDASINGAGFDPLNGVHNFSGTLYSSLFGQVEIDEIQFESTLIEGFLEHEYSYSTGNERMGGSGWIDFTSQEPQFALKGDAANINLARFFKASPIPSTSLDLDYNIELQGLQVGSSFRPSEFRR
ncbi:MAG: hypothetical protein U5K69_17555 [Balneolaceae bacterium]|nr:hypothetical protein [Balneolaceae bacterium]